MTVGQAACRLLCRYTQKHLGCVLCWINRLLSYSVWNAPDQIL